MPRLIAFLAPLLFFATAQSATLADSPTGVDDFAGKPRLFVLTDIGNEPDDQMSFVRLLLYSNEIDIEGLVATTSTWQKEYAQPEFLHALIDGYAEVQANLAKHASGWPDAASLHARVSSGPEGYGIKATDDKKASSGAEALIGAALRDDPRPLWVAIWGGANTLAEALIHARHRLSPAAFAALLAKLRVNSISDQDDAGPWIRREFPTLFYIVKPSGPNAEEYASATWTGISGDVYYRNCTGADPSTVSNQWLGIHVRNKGPLGKLYPRFQFIMEGDTPSFLGLVNNGLASYFNPSWGGWGGRYIYRQPYGESHAIWTQGGDAFARITSQDSVHGLDGKLYVSDQATIWRWRPAFQNDFVARMDWTIKEVPEANHAPLITLNGSTGTTPLYVAAEVGKPVVLDASTSRDPDGQRLNFRWFQYSEAGFVPGQGLARVTLASSNLARTTATVADACRPAWMPTRESCGQSSAHVILEVTDNGTPPLTSYRRAILSVRTPAAR